MNERTRTLTRRDIAKRIADAQQITFLDADRSAQWVLDAITELLLTADPEVRIELRDFGVFEVKLTRSKPRARNPKTGQIVFVPARRKSHFKPSKLLKEFLSQPITISEENIPKSRSAARLSRAPAPPRVRTVLPDWDAKSSASPQPAPAAESLLPSQPQPDPIPPSTAAIEQHVDLLALPETAVNTRPTIEPSLPDDPFSAL